MRKPFNHKRLVFTQILCISYLCVYFQIFNQLFLAYLAVITQCDCSFPLCGEISHATLCSLPSYNHVAATGQYVGTPSMSYAIAIVAELGRQDHGDEQWFPSCIHRSAIKHGFTPSLQST